MVFYETYKLKVEHECIRHQKNIFKNQKLLSKMVFSKYLLGGNYMILVSRTKFQPVQPGQILLYDYMRKLNFISARWDSFLPDICLDLYTFYFTNFCKDIYLLFFSQINVICVVKIQYKKCRSIQMYFYGIFQTAQVG